MKFFSYSNTIIMLIFHLIHTQKEQHPRFYYGLLNTTRWIIIPGAVVLAVLVWINPEVIPFGFGKRLQSVLSPLLRDQIFIVASVAEHIPSPWSIFYFNTLIPLVLLPLGIFFSIKRLNPADILLRFRTGIWTVMGTQMIWSKLWVRISTILTISQ